jgi:TRAP-type C4-dicarboxylate transport system permease small subunit
MSEVSAQQSRATWGRLQWVVAFPRIVIAWLLIIAICNLLIGVFLRYVMIRVTDYFDWPSIEFFWVEEVGELALAWLTLIGAAVGVADRVHFAVGVVAQRLSPIGHARLDRVLHAGVAAFGVAATISGVQLTRINSELTSPGLGINLGWLYGGAAVGGVLITIYSLRIVLGFAPSISTSGHGA